MFLPLLGPSASEGPALTLSLLSCPAVQEGGGARAGLEKLHNTGIRKSAHSRTTELSVGLSCHSQLCDLRPESNLVESQNLMKMGMTLPGSLTCKVRCTLLAEAPAHSP